MRTLIKNASIIDGTGNIPFVADILFDNHILEINHNITDIQATTIHADGKFVTPGFIDVHSHGDLATFLPNGFEGKVWQGITTELIGLCGLGVAPLPQYLQQAHRQRLIIGNPDISWDWDDLPSYYQALNNRGMEVNIGAFVPHGLLRLQICGDNSQPMTATQLSQLAVLCDNTLKSGALGVSLGLIYYPAIFSDKQELITVATMSAKHNKPIVVHMRSESDEILEALQELIDISQKTGCQLHISHVKLIGKRNASKLPKLLNLIEKYNLTFDQYPYHYGSTTLFSILPPALLKDYPSDEVFTVLANPYIRQQIKERFDETIISKRGETWDNLPALLGWKNIIICQVQTLDAMKWIGKSISQCANENNQTAVDFVLDLLIQEQGNVRMIDFFMDEGLVETIFTHPNGMVGTDSIWGGQLHPRVNGTFPKIINEFIHNKNLLPLEKAIHKMTLFSAQTFNIKKRGKLAVGYHADIAMFSSSFKDYSTIEHSDNYAKGMINLWVNGKCKIENEKYQPIRSGNLIYMK